MKQVEVTVWSDFVCPWCWIATHRLERAAHTLAEQLSVNFVYKSYRLARGSQPSDYRQAIAQKLGSEQTAQQMLQAVGEQAIEEGLTYNFEQMLFGDTTLAHALLKSTDDPTLRAALSEQISFAGTTAGRNIFDPSVLLAIAEEAGLDPEQLNLEDPALHTRITSDEQEASQIANGVPLFVFNNQLYLSGAQPLEAFQQALLQAAANSPDQLEDAEAAACSVDGCKPD